VPEVWSKTVLIVNFDENDGYFDHMPSPSAPSLNPTDPTERPRARPRCPTRP
jgi:phospholipase C